jgi:putative transposase
VPSEDEEHLRAFLRSFSVERPRWGWRRSADAARDAGWRVNNKRIHRLWRDEGLRVPYKKRKKPLRGTGLLVGAMCPIRPNVVWALDFQIDQTADGRTIKLLNIIDEFTRECLTIEVDRSIDADAVVACLEKITIDRPAPTYLRFDIQTVRSSSPTPLPTGAGSTRRAPCSSTPDHSGRTPGSSRSTVGFGTST